MKLILKSNVAGEIRLIVLSEKPALHYVAEPAERSLVYSSNLQDCISNGYKPAKSGYGALPKERNFTSTARLRIREFGGLVDATGRERTVFLTGTLPGSTELSLKSLAMWSSWLISRLSQWLRDSYKDAHFFGVWEYQKRGALHLHIVVQTTTEAQAAQLKQRWKKRWVSLLDGVGKRSSCDMFARKDGTTWQTKRWVVRTDAQTVERSAARYLAKYLSKKQSKLYSRLEAPPGNWWFASRSLRVQAKLCRWQIEITKLSPNEALSIFERTAARIVELCSVAYPVFNQYDKRYKGVIGMSPPPVAGAIMRAIVPVLRVLQNDHLPVFPSDSMSLPAVATIFSGLRLSTA